MGFKSLLNKKKFLSSRGSGSNPTNSGEASADTESAKNEELSEKLDRILEKLELKK